MQQIEITGVTGTGPYQVEVCDITNTTCIVVTGSTNIPPTYTFDVPPPFGGTNSLLIKIIDSLGCEIFQYYTCPPTPTPSLTPTPTPTPTPTNTCHCYEITNTGMTDGYFDYTDCFGVSHINVLVNNGVTVYFCGQNISNLINTVYTSTQYCESNTCPSPNVNLCFKINNYLAPPDWYCQLAPISYFNSKPVYQVLINNCTVPLIDIYVFWDNVTNRWLFFDFNSSILIQHLDNPGFLPISTGTPYSWVDDYGLPFFKILETKDSITCP
jgi:hypothetical protein